MDLPRIEPKTISCYTKLNNENGLFCASFEAHFFELSFPPLETLFSRRRFETLFSRMALPALAVATLDAYYYAYDCVYYYAYCYAYAYA